MVAVGSRSLIEAKMMTCFCAILTALSLVTVENFSVTGVEKRLLTTFMVSACAILRSYVLLGSIIAETSNNAFFEVCSLLGDFSVFGGIELLVMICSICYVGRKS